MIGRILVVLFYSILSASVSASSGIRDVPTLKPLNWAGGGSAIFTGYSVNRVVKVGSNFIPYTYNATALESTVSPASMVIDVENKRMLLDMGAGGLYIYSQNSSIIQLGGGAPCGFTSFGYDKQMLEYSTPIHTNTVHEPHFGKLEVYTGINKDVGSCFEEIAVTVTVDNDKFVRNWDWSHPWWLRPDPSHPNILVRSLIAGSVWFDSVYPMEHIDDQYFQIPVTCVNPIDYCAPGIFFP